MCAICLWFTRRTFHPEFAAKMLNNFPTDRQPKTCALRFIGHGITPLAESFKNEPLIGLWNPGAIVVDSDHGKAISRFEGCGD